jgi:hypothetical protein
VKNAGGLVVFVHIDVTITSKCPIFHNSSLSFTMIHGINVAN